jgi:A/G-specific adenine glycosylase
MPRPVGARNAVVAVLRVKIPQIQDFRRRLLAWFDCHKRDLPWRRTRDPYAIWVSEIMLQQTRVAAVLEHYAAWMGRFPSVETLAAAGEEEVLAVWSGLGYYRRARFLHRGAKVVAADYAARLPETAAELRRLPGIGAYTSAAVASIAFGEVVAVVDGNVERVLLRQVGAAEFGAAKDHGVVLSTAEIQALADRMVDPERPGDFNQAMMELGATVCLPRNPLCLHCPVQQSCRTRGEHPTAARKPSTNAEIAYALAKRTRRGREEILLEERPQSSTVMPGMWDLPKLEGEVAVEPVLVVRHSIMQTNYRVSVVALAGKQIEETPGPECRRWVDVAELTQLPLTGLARKITKKLGLLGHHGNAENRYPAA